MHAQLEEQWKNEVASLRGQVSDLTDQVTSLTAKKGRKKRERLPNGLSVSIGHSTQLHLPHVAWLDQRYPPIHKSIAVSYTHLTLPTKA